VQVAIFGDAAVALRIPAIAVALGKIERNEKLYAEGSIRKRVDYGRRREADWALYRDMARGAPWRWQE
jgi:hypothetical protein